MTNKSIQTKSKFLDKGKSINAKKFVGGGVIVFLIAITPYLFYMYKSFPTDTKVWETFFFSFETAYLSLYHYAWLLSGKIIPIYLLLIWFFTCKHWWHWIILLPIAMYVFQLWGIINQSRRLDEVELIYMIPEMLVIIPAVYLIRAKLFFKIRETDLSEFEEELKKERTLLQELKELFR